MVCNSFLPENNGTKGAGMTEANRNAVSASAALLLVRNLVAWVSICGGLAVVRRALRLESSNADLYVRDAMVTGGVGAILFVLRTFVRLKRTRVRHEHHQWYVRTLSEVLTEISDRQASKTA